MKESLKGSPSSTTSPHIKSAADRTKPSAAGTWSETYSSACGYDVAVSLQPVRRRRWRLIGFGWIDKLAANDRNAGDSHGLDQPIQSVTKDSAGAVIARDFERIARSYSDFVRIAMPGRRGEPHAARFRKRRLD